MSQNKIDECERSPSQFSRTIERNISEPNILR